MRKFRVEARLLKTLLLPEDLGGCIGRFITDAVARPVRSVQAIGQVRLGMALLPMARSTRGSHASKSCKVDACRELCKA